MEKTPRSVRRAVALLRAVARNAAKGARLSGLAREADIHVATAQRLLGALAQEGLVSYDAVSRRYTLGVELYTLGAEAHQYHLRDLLHSTLERIAETTGDTVYLVIPNGRESLCIALVEGNTPIRIMSYRVGMSTPLGIAAGSLALLSVCSESEAEAIVLANAPRYRDLYGATPERVRECLAAARERGYSVSEGLFMEGVVGVGVPFRGPGGELGAMSVAAIAARMPPARAREIAALVRREIGIALGRVEGEP